MRNVQDSFIWSAGTPHEAVELVRVSDLAAVARRVETAIDSASRRRGLLGRDGLPEDAALIIAPCNAIHTFFMRFAIDVLFVDRSGTIVKVASNVTPWRMSAAPRAFAVIEMAAGSAARTGLAEGDTLALTPVEPSQDRTH